MKRVLMHLVPWLLAACTVDTPVVEGDRLGEELGAWCQSMCDKGEACGGDSRAICLGNCVEYFSGFAGKGSVCRDAGLRVMDCMEEATCEELDRPSHCRASEEQAACLESIGETTCRSSFTDDPSHLFECNLGFDACTDGNDYSLECLGPEGESPECKCVVSGLTTGRFVPSQLVCPSLAEAVQICAWPMVNGNDRPPTLCDVGGGEGLDGFDCSVQYGDCSDGRAYEVRCVASEESVVCECNVDGQTVGTYESPTGICPFLDDPDSGCVEANYGCGFKIAPIAPG